MELLEKGHIKPIHPMKVFPFEDIESSLRYLRAGTHLGKVVISNGLGSIVQVPVKFTERLPHESNTNDFRCELHRASLSFGLTHLI
jgi:Zinc-binding dehydrogenase